MESSNSHAGWDMYREAEKARSSTHRAEQAEALYGKARQTALDLESELKREKLRNQYLREEIKALKNKKNISDLERDAESTKEME